jgi:hypothetical protein
MQKVENRFMSGEKSNQFLQKMREYVEKQSIWDEEPNDSTILLHYPNEDSTIKFSVDDSNDEVTHLGCI